MPSHLAQALGEREGSMVFFGPGTHRGFVKSGGPFLVDRRLFKYVWDGVRPQPTGEPEFYFKKRRCWIAGFYLSTVGLDTGCQESRA